MRKALLIGLLFFIPILTFAQNETTPNIDKRLYEVFEVDYLERLQKENPTLIHYYNFFLDHSYNIIELEDGKKKNMKEVVISDINNFNILAILNEQNLTRSQNLRMFYKVKDSDKVLELLSGETFIEKFNQQLERSN